MTFDEWFEANREILTPMMRVNELDALWLAWYAGYQKGLDDRIKIDEELWTIK